MSYVLSGRRGASGEEIVKSILFCKVHYVLYSDIKKDIGPFPWLFCFAIDISYFNLLSFTSEFMGTYQ